ncbi:disintegrin and metalloproteinase domain-containing protein 2-like [Elgaria multicarinata webbii]|uniref:disintegrin and metalloproteinase domain-containing protein 2-like n=1 Tax=Elgaria multicarinata webbii TaxID=159646 RepID=UPI002FCCED85
MYQYRLPYRRPEARCRRERSVTRHQPFRYHVLLHKNEDFSLRCRHRLFIDRGLHPLNQTMIEFPNTRDTTDRTCMTGSITDPRNTIQMNVDRRSTTLTLFHLPGSSKSLHLGPRHHQSTVVEPRLLYRGLLHRPRYRTMNKRCSRSKQQRNLLHRTHLTMSTVDLKDAYFHISMRKSHQTYLCFIIDTRQFQFTVLPFGLTTAPRVFTKRAAAARVAMAVLRLALALALLTACLLSALGSQRTFLQVVIPQRIPVYASGNTERMSYDMNLKEKLYTIHLRQQSILTNDFRIYTYTQSGNMMSIIPSVQRDCYYQGYIETYTNSLVMLSTCSGLSGLLLFENITYGIEPVESASGFQHLIYQTEYNDEDFNVSKENYSIDWTTEISQRASPEVPINFSTVRYVEMHVIVAKTLFDYMGSDEDIVTGKIMKLISFINTMFFKLNMRIILSSLEFWLDNDKISTTGTPDEMLGKFVEWKKEHLTLRPHDVSFLFVYRDKADSLGSTFPKQICVKPSSAGIAVYQNGITLETFSVILAQLLGISLGLHFDNARQCFCPGSTCVMNTNAVQSSGAKFFSSCSIKDFRDFLGFGSPQCLMNRPRIDITYRAPQCGNSIVEDGEQCDCGTVKECQTNVCCLSDCTLRAGKECAQGECCWQNTCKFKAKGTLCRDTPDVDCDLREYCNGTSSECTDDFFVQDGQPCEAETGVCMKGVCQSPDRWCRKVFGQGSKSGSPQCYEEINSQSDRMGHCGSSARGYQHCQWKDLKCGKLVCEYPSKKPFVIENAAIIYAKVQHRLCVTLDYMKGPTVKDTFLVQDGSVCAKDKICMNQKCVDRAVIKATCDPIKNCHNNGVCNNRGNCHCEMGWAPPNCTTEEKGGIGGSIDSTYRSGPLLSKHHGINTTTRNWLLIGFFLFLPVAVGSVIIVIKLRDVFSKVKVEEEEDEEEDYDKEG